MVMPFVEATVSFLPKIVDVAVQCVIMSAGRCPVQCFIIVSSGRRFVRGGVLTVEIFLQVR